MAGLHALSTRSIQGKDTEMEENMCAKVSAGLLELSVNLVEGP